MVINEVVDLAKRSKRPCFILKEDFEKIYNSVSWYFLDYMLIIFGFSERLRSW